MLDKLQVKDIFIKLDDYPNISINAPLGHAFRLMHHELEEKKKFRTILVLDDDDHLKGYLSIRDLIRAVGPDYLRKRQPDVKGNQPFNMEAMQPDLSSLALIWQDGFTVKVHDQLMKPVSECMTLMYDFVGLEDHFAKALYIMLFHDVLIVPVLDEEQVVGVVRLVDLFEHVSESVEKQWLPKQKQR